MNIVVLPQAADEFEDAAAHYADKQPGLGQGRSGPSYPLDCSARRDSPHEYLPARDADRLRQSDHRFPALARNRRIMASSVGSPSVSPCSPAPISMLQMSYRGGRRSRFYGQNAELASHDCRASLAVTAGS
jgi:hypothetical protein